MQPNRRIVVLGASAGGVEALSEVVSGLPEDFGGTVLVVLHLAPEAPSVLPAILGRASRLPARVAVDGERIAPGTIHVAPPDHHLVVRGDEIRLVRGPRENASRPAIDPLFRSAARSFGEQVVGVILTGNLGDGTLGLRDVKASGGLAVVQSPAEALFPSMPRSAIAHVDIDYVLPVREIGPLLARVCAGVSRVVASAERPVVARSGPDEVELDGTAFVDASIVTNETLGGQVSHFTCPECHGTLWEYPATSPVKYRCRVGHSYIEPLLLQEKEHGLESALWTALTALEESATLARRIADRATVSDRATMATWFARRAEMLDARGRVVRGLIEALPDAANVERSTLAATPNAMVPNDDASDEDASDAP